MLSARAWLDRLHGLPQPARPLRILNVCGGHERTIAEAGLRSLLPDWIELIPGPGCPVCVCPEESIWQAMQIALGHPVTLVAFGDMLRVPVNVSRHEPDSLLAARARGADIRPVASPLEVLALARALSPRPVVFFVAGFETTLAPVAALLAEPLPDNLSLLLAGRRTWPAVARLLTAEHIGFDALIAPGHVAAIMGADEWRFVPQRHGLPAAVAGFSMESLLAAIDCVAGQHLAGVARLDNAYPEVVSAAGNRRAQALMGQAFDIVAARWRGIGEIAESGYRLAAEHGHRAAENRFALPQGERKRAGQMPPGCDCTAVLLAQKTPQQCRLYGTGCTPQHPVGPCMVSDEGACRIWWAAGLRAEPHSRPAVQLSDIPAAGILESGQ